MVNEAVDITEKLSLFSELAEGRPVREPEATLAEIRDVAAEQLPGAHLRRRLYWRYSLLWHRSVAR